MRFYGEYCFIDVIPCGEARSEYGAYEVVSDHGISYAVYVIPYKEGCQRHHDAPDWGLNFTPGEIVGTWDRGEKKETDGQKK